MIWEEVKMYGNVSLVLSPGPFYCWNSRNNCGRFVINFNFPYMSWVFCSAFSISSFYWKFKIISISNYNQHFIFKKAWEEFCRYFISYIWKYFELAVINIYCNCHEVSTSCTKIRIPNKDCSEYLLISISFNRLR